MNTDTQTTEAGADLGNTITAALAQLDLRGEYE